MSFLSGFKQVRATTRFRAAAALVAIVLAKASGSAVDFPREIRPLLEQHCVKCHGPEKQKGGLRFDTKAGAFKAGESGEKAIVPGHASESRLIKLVLSRDKASECLPKATRCRRPRSIF